MSQEQISTYEVQLREGLEKLVPRIDWVDYDLEEIRSLEALTDMLEEAGAFNVEIIYYYEAMRYLTVKDSSLRWSLELAQELGYTLDSINSELLASLLASDNIRLEFGAERGSIKALFEELNDQEL